MYFDDFSVTHTHSPVVQRDDYYPFGLAFNTQTREDATSQRWKFQGQEHVDDLGLNWDSFKWRNHQPDIGRFFNLDPLAEDYYYNSPYAFSENKVTAHVELEGLEAVSYLLTQTIGGVGHTDYALEGDAGIVFAGAKIKGALGIGYDSKGNFALYGQTGGFADLFTTFGGTSRGGNPSQTGEFALGFGGGVEIEESYNWGLNSVLDLAGEAYSMDVQANAYWFYGIDVGVNQNSSHHIVGVNWGVVAGLGTPADIGVTGTSTSLVAFQLGDISDLRSSKRSLISKLGDLGVSHYSISLTSVASKNGSSSLRWQAIYTDSAGNLQTVNRGSGVSFQVLENRAFATQRVLDTLK